MLVGEAHRLPVESSRRSRSKAKSLISPPACVPLSAAGASNAALPRATGYPSGEVDMRGDGQAVGAAVGDAGPTGEPVAVGLAVAGEHAAAAIATTRAKPTPRTTTVLDRPCARHPFHVEYLVNIVLLRRCQPDGPRLPLR